VTEETVDIDRERRHLRDGRAYNEFKRQAEIPLLFAALLFIPILAAPYIFTLPNDIRNILTFMAWLIWASFVAEYIVLFTLAPHRWTMVKTHLLDLLIIVLPFLRPLRAARSARLLRLLVISGRIGVAFRSIRTRDGFRNFLLAVCFVIAVGGLLTYAFEHNHEGSNINSLPDAIWWAIVTSTTVGYGDFAPVSNEGRAVATVLMVVGIGLLGVITASIAALFVGGDDQDQMQMLHDRLDRIEQLIAEQKAAAPQTTLPNEIVHETNLHKSQVQNNQHS
jgi:voltage-gated potassium channel